MRVTALAEAVRSEILNLHTRFPVVGYCMMPDHIHLLLYTAGSTPGRIMHGFKGRVSRQVRLLCKGIEVWQPGFWDHVVRKEEGLYATLQYILLNPVRAGLVTNWWDYEWSGAPMLGKKGPELFSEARQEDVIWRDLLERPGGGL